MTMISCDFLVPIFVDFWQQKHFQIRAEQNHSEMKEFLFKIRQLLNVGLISEQDVREYIRPIAFLEPEKAYIISQLQTAYRNLMDKRPIDFTTYEPLSYFKKQNALVWLSVYFVNLHLPGIQVDEDTKQTQLLGNLPILLPYRQCQYCGRLLDEDEKPYQEPKPNKRPRKQYCHVGGCSSVNDSNPSAHEEKCCYRQWAKVKRSFRQGLINHSNEDISETHKQRKITEMFLKFCEKRYQECLNIRWAVIPKSFYPDAVNYLNEKNILMRDYEKYLELSELQPEQVERDDETFKKVENILFPVDDEINYYGDYRYRPGPSGEKPILSFKPATRASFFKPYREHLYFYNPSKDKSRK